MAMSINAIPMQRHQQSHLVLFLVMVLAVFLNGRIPVFAINSNSSSTEDEVIPLLANSLEEIKERDNNVVSVPGYKRAEMRAGIMHFGVGNFFRSHLARYIHDLMEDNSGTTIDNEKESIMGQWAIVGVNLLPIDDPKQKKLMHQDNLWTLVEDWGPASPAEYRKRATIIGSMVEYFGTNNLEDVYHRLTDDASIRIVTMTITEGGYLLKTGGFNSTESLVLDDAQRLREGLLPTSVFGLIVSALEERRKRGLSPFTVASCDNILHNGDVAKNAVLGMAMLHNVELAHWIADNVAFPNSMVDRITPITTNQERRRCVEEYGIRDEMPVFCEGFRQWILEDNFPEGRPPLEQVGVKFVHDVTPYEQMKLRILNGAHSAMAYIGTLLGIEYVHEFMANELAYKFWNTIILKEIIPGVASPPNTDLYVYFQEVKGRFQNQAIADRLSRLCSDGSNKIPKFLHPSIEARVKSSNTLNGLALLEAIWCRYVYIQMAHNETLTDPNSEMLNEHAKRAIEGNDRNAWLEMKEVYSPLLTHPEFTMAFHEAFQIVNCHECIEKGADGLRKVMQQYIETSGGVLYV